MGVGWSGVDRVSCGERGEATVALAPPIVGSSVCVATIMSRHMHEGPLRSSAHSTQHKMLMAQYRYGLLKGTVGCFALVCTVPDCYTSLRTIPYID